MNEGGNEANVEAVEDNITESIKEEPFFFSLPTNKIIVRICEAKCGEETLILNAVEANEVTYKKCVRIIFKALNAAQSASDLATRNRLRT